MATDDSISAWIAHLKAGDPQAANQLWNRFFQRLLGFACQKMKGAPRRVADEEDAVLSALHTVFRRAQQGEFPQLSDRTGLWQLLLTVTERKMLNQARDQRRLKRGGGKVSGESAFLYPGSEALAGIDQLPSLEPTPEFAASMAESVGRLLGMLDEDLRTIALLKLEGYSNEEIARQIDRSQPTVERRLRLIRAKWQPKAE